VAAKPKPSVVIVVDGGNVTHVLTNDPRALVDTLDFDNAREDGTAAKLDRRFDRYLRTMHSAGDLDG
jgi:hypothetical protein